MTTRIPHTRPPLRPAIAGDRFAGTIGTVDPAGRRIALLGAPDELGVRLNHGRPGASDGPDAFRAALAQFGTTYDAARAAPLEVAVFDAGDVIPADGDDAAALDETHHRITEAAQALHALGLVPVVIGGGHDLTLPGVRALAQRAACAVGGINVDPHLDVRETVGSGMPYRRLIEGGWLDARRFTELGVGRFSNSREHIEWLRARGGTIILGDELLSSPLRNDRTCEEQSGGLKSIAAAIDLAWRISLPTDDSSGFLSVDLDVIDGAQAPGVSSMNPSGLPVAVVCEIAHRAGAEPRIRHFDIMELSPPNDQPAIAGRTARIAALLFLHFVAGFGERLRHDGARA